MTDKELVEGIWLYRRTVTDDDVRELLATAAVRIKELTINKALD
jgi:hypothetical protein